MQIFRFIFRFDCSFAFVWLKVGRLCAAGKKSMFKMSPGFTVGALIITGILVALYTVFW
jgi:hypothetical protein